MQYLSLRDQLLKERAKTAALQEELIKKSSDIDFIAMMSDIELGSDEDMDTGSVTEEV